MTDWVVTSPVRLDMFLSLKEGVKSRASAQKAIKGKRVFVNGKIVAKPSLRLSGGDRVSLLEEERTIDRLFERHSDLQLDVLYEDDACLVIDKPRGVAVHPGAGMKIGETTVLSALTNLFSKRSLPFSESEVLVHRLDKDTTGCLIAAKNPEAHLKLQQQFLNRTIEKKYLALVAGIPSPAAAIIDADIGRHTGNRTKMSVVQATKSRYARTTYRVIASSQGVALLALDLHTGRTHQIRVHLKAIGNPVLGDRKYGDSGVSVLNKKFGIDFLCLHAWRLKFRSPTGNDVTVKSPVPKEFMGLISKLGMSVKLPG
jgi:23S rRNA pseudouridine1911/1915/1917 synthase